MGKNHQVLIDVDNIIDERMAGKKVPRFVRSFVKKLIHQDFLNKYFEKGDLGIDFAKGALDYLGITLDVKGLENIPAQGRFTFAGNHPLGGIDALSMIAVIGEHYDGHIRYIANDFLAAIGQLSEYMVPVSKTGRNEKGLGSSIDEIFATENQIIWFPAGKCARRYDGVITDPEWKKTFITKSRESCRDIIPMWFSGCNSKRFYRIDSLCRTLGIKTNIAMFLLPDELYRGRGGHHTLIIGKPIPWQTFTRDRKDSEWALYVRKKTYELEKQ